MIAVLCLTLVVFARLRCGLGASFLVALTCIVSLGSVDDLDSQMVLVAVSSLGSVGWGCGWWGCSLNLFSCKELKTFKGKLSLLKNQ